MMDGAPAVGALRHGVPTPMAFFDLASLDGASVVGRLVPLRTPSTTGAGAFTLRFDVDPNATVITTDVWPDFFVGLSF